jgi:hypothetical protein
LSFVSRTDLDRILTYGQGPNGVGSTSAPGLSSRISPLAHVEDDQRQFHAFSSSVVFGVEEGGPYLDDRVAEMFGRVQQRSLRDLHVVPIIVHNLETGEVYSRFLPMHKRRTWCAIAFVSC